MDGTRQHGSEFSGVSGRVLTGAISGASLFSGVVIGLMLLVVNWILVTAGAGALAAVFTLVVLSATLARYAVNGLYGEWSGTVFSSVGGPWTVVGTVALRHLALTSTWYIPLTLMGLAVDGPAEARDASALAMLGAMRGALLVGALHILASVLTPPLFLIMAVSAQDFSELFSADAWRARFVGRRDDVVSIYAVYAGGLGLVTLVSLPAAMLALVISSKLAFLVAGLALCLIFGVSVNLLGRLCGFFACTEPEVRPGTVDTGDGERPPVVDVGGTAPTPAEPPRPAGACVGDHSRPVLLDAKPRVDRALADFDSDPQAALAQLRQLCEEFAPHPLVLKTLALLAYSRGRLEESVETAARAIPLCIERGQSFLAAELFRELRQQRSALGLSREQLLATGHALVTTEDYATAAKAYGAVIVDDPSDAQAIKGLLQVAEAILHQKQKPEAAIKVYRLLLQHCSDSPLAEFMREGREECERRMTHVQPSPSR